MAAEILFRQFEFLFRFSIHSDCIGTLEMTKQKYREPKKIEANSGNTVSRVFPNLSLLNLLDHFHPLSFGPRYKVVVVHGFALQARQIILAEIGSVQQDFELARFIRFEAKIVIDAVVADVDIIGGIARSIAKIGVPGVDNFEAGRQNLRQGNVGHPLIFAIGKRDFTVKFGSLRYFRHVDDFAFSVFENHTRRQVVLHWLFAAYR